MIARFGLSRVTAVILLFGVCVFSAHTQKAKAAPVDPAVKITKSNFVAANGANPPTADPQGTWSKPADGIDWRIEWTYGTGVKEKFKANDTGVGGAKTYSGADKATTGTWGGVGAENLKNPLPAGSSIRVQLLRRENCTWVMKKEDFIEIP